MARLRQRLLPVSQPQTWMVRVPVELREGGPLSTTRMGRKYTFCSWRLNPVRWVRMLAVFSGDGRYERVRGLWVRETKVKQRITHERLNVWRTNPHSQLTDVCFFVFFLSGCTRFDETPASVYFYLPSCSSSFELNTVLTDGVEKVGV